MVLGLWSNGVNTSPRPDVEALRIALARIAYWPTTDHDHAPGQAEARAMAFQNIAREAIRDYERPSLNPPGATR